MFKSEQLDGFGDNPVDHPPFCFAAFFALLLEMCTEHRDYRVPYSQVPQIHPSVCLCHTNREKKAWGAKLFLTDRNASQIEVRNQRIANFPKMTSRNTV